MISLTRCCRQRAASLYQQPLRTLSNQSSRMQEIVRNNISSCEQGIKTTSTRMFYSKTAIEGECKLFKRILKISVATGVVGGIYLGLVTDKSDFDRYFTKMAVKNSSSLCLLPVSHDYLKDELFNAVHYGNFSQAKFLIDKGGIDVNSIKKWMDWDEPLLESFYPKTAEDLDTFIDFTNFVLERGYKHLNRPIKDGMGQYNLITNIYNRHMFRDEPELRRKLIAFFLEKGVDPSIQKDNFESGLLSACFHGDGRFFIETCKRYKRIDIPEIFSQMSDKEVSQLFSYTSVRANPSTLDDLLYLLQSGVPIRENKEEILKELEDDFKGCEGKDKEQFEKVKKAIEKSYQAKRNERMTGLILLENQMHDEWRENQRHKELMEKQK